MARRGSGEGTIYWREDEQRWIGQLRVGGGERKTVYGKTRQIVQRKLAQMRRDVEEGVIIAPERQTVASYLAEWLETVQSKLSVSGLINYRYFVEQHITPRIGRVKLAKLTAQQVQNLYASCLNDGGLSTTTVNHLHSCLHAALEAAVRLGLMPRNVSDLVEVPRVRHHEMQPLNRDQARALLAQVERHRLAALFTLALATGMRRGELLGLHWADVDLDDASLQVRSSLDHRGGQWVWSEAKTKRSRRRLALSAPVVEALRAHQKRQKVLRFKVGPAWEDQGLVFSTTIGGPLLGRNILRLLHKQLALAGLPRIRFHDLRHTAATLALLARVNPKVVSEMLGHASVSITLDLYSHVLPDMQQDAAAVMAKVLFG